MKRFRVVRQGEVYWIEKREVFLIFIWDWVRIGNSNTLDGAKEYITKYKEREKIKVLYEE